MCCVCVLHGLLSADASASIVPSHSQHRRANLSTSFLHSVPSKYNQQGGPTASVRLQPVVQGALKGPPAGLGLSRQEAARLQEAPGMVSSHDQWRVQQLLLYDH